MWPHYASENDEKNENKISVKYTFQHTWPLPIFENYIFSDLITYWSFCHMFDESFLNILTLINSFNYWFVVLRALFL